jgi:hypothetical protein
MLQYAALHEENASRNWTKAEKPPACKGCTGSAVVVQRLAASCAARAAYWRARYTQASEELRAGRERRRARVVAIARLEVDDKAVAALRAVPPCDVCVACHHEVEKVRRGLQGQQVGRESVVIRGFEGLVFSPFRSLPASWLHYVLQLGLSLARLSCAGLAIA